MRMLTIPFDLRNTPDGSIYRGAYTRSKVCAKEMVDLSAGGGGGAQKQRFLIYRLRDIC